MRFVESIRHAATVVEIFQIAAEQHHNRPAFCSRNPGGTYTTHSYAEFFETSVALSTALIDLGLQPREHVALLADNRFEWVVADCATLLAAAADVPRGTDVTMAEIEYIVDHSDARIVFVEHAAMRAKIQLCRSRLSKVDHVVVMARGEKLEDGALGLWDLVERGRALRAAGDRRVEERVAQVRPDDMFTIIYTSGTTGQPKGVMLTHGNMASQIRNLCFEINRYDRMLSILPIWHIYERVACMLAVGYGAATYYTSVRTVADDLKTVRPTIMFSAPRVWESLYHRIVNTVHKAGPIRRAMFRIAYFFSRRVRHSSFFIEGRRLDLEGRPRWRTILQGIGESCIYVALIVPYLVMDGLVTRKLRNALGGRFRCTVSGGGALPPHVDEFFNYIGIPVLEGYGLTETCPVIAVRNWKHRIIGTVGPVWGETELRIVDLTTGEVVFPDPRRHTMGRGLQGEIQVRGPQVTPGYYKDPELTGRAFRDGWFATGDIGIMTFNDCVKIVGRCKETIVLLSGENVEPVPIENKISESSYVRQCMVVGQDQKYLAALIVTDVDLFTGDGISAASIEELSANPAAGRIINREIKTHVCAATGFKHHEMIHDWRLLSKPFEVGDELTNTYKLKRHVITEKYAGLIREIFHEPQGGRRTVL